MKNLLFVICCVFNTSLFASYSLQNLNEEEVGNIAREFAANFTHTSVGGAYANGDVFGISFGVVGGLTDAPEIDRISKEVDSSADIPRIPHGGIFGEVTVPFGFVAEAVAIPETSTDEGAIKHSSFALKWELTRLWDGAPVAVSLRYHFSDSYIEYTDEISGVSSTIKWESEVTGYNITVGKKVGPVEAYAGYGRANGDVDINIDSTATIFNFTTNSNFNVEPSGAHFFSGALVSILGLKIGVEYAKAMQLSKVTVRAGLSF